MSQAFRGIIISENSKAAAARSVLMRLVEDWNRRHNIQNPITTALDQVTAMTNENVYMTLHLSGYVFVSGVWQWRKAVV